MSIHGAIKIANDLLKNHTECSFGVVTKEGYPHVATRSFCIPANIVKCYISTNLGGNLVKSLLVNNNASICVHNDNDNITLLGKAKIIDDLEIKKRMWKDWFIDHYPNGVQDKEYTVIEFETKKLSLWVNREVIKLSIEDVIEIQSRCGLLCSRCTFKVSHNCQGCIQTNGHPFYGECHIAKCCQDKGYIHCGQCNDVPCDNLYEYSYGEGEHCDDPKGSRLEILNIWESIE